MIQKPHPAHKARRSQEKTDFDRLLSAVSLAFPVWHIGPIRAPNAASILNETAKQEADQNRRVEGALQRDRLFRKLLANPTFAKGVELLYLAAGKRARSSARKPSSELTQTEIATAHSYLRALIEQVRLLDLRRADPSARLHPIKADREKALRAIQTLVHLVGDDRTAMPSLSGAAELKSSLLEFHRSIESVTSNGRSRATRSGRLACEREFVIGLSESWCRATASPLQAGDRSALAQFAIWAGYSDRGTIDELIATGEQRHENRVSR